MREASQPLRISLFAPNGRMGKAIAAVAAQDPAYLIDGDDGEVLIDFSAPQALAASLDRALSANIPALIGTTGLDDEADRQIAAAAEKIAVLRAANTSLGIALLSDLVERAARVLGSDWDIEITETHHRLKADAPSGTALLLGQAAARGRNSELEPQPMRHGTGLTRKEGAIGFSSLRGGTVAGDHDVLFLGSDERVVLSIAPKVAWFSPAERSRGRAFSSASQQGFIRCGTSLEQAPLERSGGSARRHRPCPSARRVRRYHACNGWHHRLGHLCDAGRSCTARPLAASHCWRLDFWWSDRARGGVRICRTRRATS